MNQPDYGAVARGPVFWKIAGAGAAFQAGSAAVDSATIVAGLVYHLTGNVFAVGAASAVLRLGWLLPQFVVGFLAQRARRRMPFYVVGAFGRAFCLAVIAVLLASIADPPPAWTAGAFLVVWTLYAFVSGIVAVPYNDIVGRSIPSAARSRMLALRFFGGGILTLGVAAIIHRLLTTEATNVAYGWAFALAAALMLVSSITFVSAGEPELPSAPHPRPTGFGAFVADGWQVLRRDTRFRLFLYTQWLGAATLMALPFYVVAALDLRLQTEDVALLLGAQTAGSLASNAAWGRIGDRLGKVELLQVVACLRLVPPLSALALLSVGDLGTFWLRLGFVGMFLVIGALINGMTIAYLGYLMEISPDDRRPAYSAWFNALASPAALLPLAGAAVVEALSIEALFIVAAGAAVVQLWLLRALARTEAS